MLPTLDMQVRRTGCFDDYLCPRQTGQLKGFFAILIIVHHLASRTRDGYFFSYFGNTGYLAVGFFFFISGYGLMLQYKEKEEGYIETFLSNRLRKVVLPFAVAMVVYYIANRILDADFSLNGALQSFAAGKPYVLFSWYVMAIILFYLIFYASARICKENYPRMVLVISAGLLIYSVLCYQLGFERHWYKTCTSFLLGTVWGIYDEPISKWLEKKWIPTLCVSLFGFLFFFYRAVQTETGSLGYFLFLHYLSSAFFCITVAVAGKKVRLNSRILTYLGDISYEIYLSQGLAMLLLRNDFRYQQSDYLFTVGVLLGTFLIAVPFSKIDSLLLQLGERRRYAASVGDLKNK